MSEFIPPKPLDTAVLFLVFNRLDTTKQVFEAIRQAKPPRLYVAADGARESKEGEDKKAQAVRDHVIKNIDWECEVKTLFREQNLGCKMAVSSAIDWFFENEEMGIILEDDCLPSQSFFWFCEELLKRYKEDMRIWHISGDNFQNSNKRGDASYYFSKYAHIWGWATWKNRWQYYDVNMKSYPIFINKMMIHNILPTEEEKKFWLMNFDSVFLKKIDTWDYQWVYTQMSQNGLSIIPNANLITNLGFGEDATHTKEDSCLANMMREEIMNINHPQFILPNKDADSYTFKTQWEIKPQHNILKKILLKLWR